MPIRPRSPQSQGASRPEDDRHSGQPHHEGVGTTYITQGDGGLNVRHGEQVTETKP